MQKIRKKEKGMKITNQQVLEFYADKPADEEHCPVTAKYLCKLKKEHENENEDDKGKKREPGVSLGKYGKLAKTFKACSKNRENRGATKDACFYTWLENHQSVALSFLLNLDVFLCNTDYYDVALQKWHLYVSWYAYLESGILGKSFALEDEAADFRCRELLLWMCEAATSAEVAEKYYENMDCPGWISKIHKEIREAIEKETIKASK